MEQRIDKKGNNPMSGWSARCYRLRNCELLQYKKGIDDFQLCDDTKIKSRYNIYNIVSTSIGPKTPYILRVDIDTPYQQESINVLLKFDDVRKKKVDHSVFVAWYRILCSSTKIVKCAQRPIPSNICFAIYYLLQKLYKHKEVLNSKFLFDKNHMSGKQQKALAKSVEKLYFNLAVRSRDYLGLDQDINDIHLLSQTLLYTLQNMPNSLLCDSYCQKLTDFVMNILNNAYSQNNTSDDGSDEECEEYEDRDIVVMRQKGYLAQIKDFLLRKYSAKKIEYRTENGFHNFHRYGFLIILFLMLNRMSCNKYYRKTRMTAKDLAQILAPVLISKQYLFQCRSEELHKSSKYLSKNSMAKSKRDQRYEQNFIKMVKILIFYAKDLFPDLDRVTWKVSTLVAAQGQEKVMIKHYNDQFSKDTKSDYYIAPILNRGKNYGVFDYKYCGAKYDEGSDEESKEDKPAQSDKQYIVRLNDESAPIHKPIIQKRVSYNQNPAYQSDIGISDVGVSDIEEEPEADEEPEEAEPEEKEDEKEEEKYEREVEHDSTDYNADINISVKGDSEDSMHSDDSDGNISPMLEYEEEKEEIVPVPVPVYQYQQQQPQLYMQQQTQQQIENAVQAQNSNASWVDCEACFYAPLRNLFGGAPPQQQQQQQQPQQSGYAPLQQQQPGYAPVQQQQQYTAQLQPQQPIQYAVSSNPQQYP